MKIVEVLGMPPQQMLDRAPKTMSFFEMQGDGTYVPKIKEGRQVCPSSRLFMYVFLCTAVLLSFDLILSALKLVSSTAVSLFCCSYVLVWCVNVRSFCLWLCIWFWRVCVVVDSIVCLEHDTSRTCWGSTSGAQADDAPMNPGTRRPTTWSFTI